MLRNDLSLDAPEVSVLATTNNGVTFQWRSTQAAGCSYQIAIGFQGGGVPVWLRLARSGNDFSGFLSTNGIDFIQIGSTQTVPLNLVTLGGLCISSGNSTNLGVATFANLTCAGPGVWSLSRAVDRLEFSTRQHTRSADQLLPTTRTGRITPIPITPRFTPASKPRLTPACLSMGNGCELLLCRPLSGAYTFWIASDDSSQLSISTDETPSGAQPVAWVSTFTAPRQWNKETSQQSAPILLQAGRRYYLEALMQQGTGNDNLAVRWQLPNGTNEEPIAAVSPAGTRLLPFTGVDSPPGIYQQPTNLTISDGLDAAFLVVVTNRGPVAYHWLRNGAPLNDASASSPVYLLNHSNPTNDNNATFVCVISNLSGSITSAPAILTVVPDTTPPSVLNASYVNPTNVVMTFSEPLETSSATNMANYVFPDGLPVVSAAFGSDNQTINLTTAPASVWKQLCRCPERDS